MTDLLTTKALAERWHVTRRRASAFVRWLHDTHGVGQKVGRDWILTDEEAERWHPADRPGPRNDKGDMMKVFYPQAGRQARPEEKTYRNRQEVAADATWADKIVKVDGGWMAFEFATEYETWRKQK